MAQTARPDSDGTVTGWTTQAGSSSNLYATVDEVVADDADYVQSAADPNPAQALRLRLSDVTDPAISTGHTVSVRAGKSASGGATVTLEVRLYQSGSTSVGAGTLIATIDSTDVAAFANLPHGQVTYTYTLTAGEADAITDYTDLWLELRADQAA